MTDINFAALAVLAAVIIFCLARFSVEKIGMIQFPFLAAATVMGFVFPQLIGIYVNDSVPEGALTRLTIYTSMCLIATVWGYSSAKRPFKTLATSFSSQRLDYAAMALMAFGFYFYLKFTSMAAEATEMYGGFWTGEITIYVFFASAFKYGFILAAVSNLQRPSSFNRIMLVIGVLTYLNTIIFLGRRQDSAELFVIVLWYLWLKRGWLPPRTVVIGALLAGMLFVNTVATYREIVVNTTGNTEATTTLADLAEINFVDLFLSNAGNAEGNYELKNAAYVLAATDARMSFDGGLSLWNLMVQNFVPGQIIGPQLKRDLMIELEDVAWLEFRYIGFPGATSTGMADTFRSFWYFGVFVFFLIGYIMKRFFLGIDRGSLAAVVALMFFTSQAMLAFTHLTHVFFCSFVNFAIFVLPALRYARLPNAGR